MNKGIEYSIIIKESIRYWFFANYYSAEKKVMTSYPETSKLDEQANIEDCRAVEIDKNNIAECLLVGPNTCSFALPFGYCFLCQHPRLSEILDNTKKIRPDK